MLRKITNYHEFEDGQAELCTPHFSLLKAPMLRMWHSLHLINDFKLLFHSEHALPISGISTTCFILHLKRRLPCMLDQGLEACVPKERKLLPGFSGFAEPIG